MNRQFAFVLTHDVESEKGLGRCRNLARLEMEFDFRSSFNFIPEGGYQVTAEMREWLTSRGFEVGVHDLHHDGKLFTSRLSFRDKAERINSHLRDWGAIGFRAGFMLRQLDWLHDLNIAYDASTFDTDPFEPQPDGANTIFPFWVSAGSGDRGYVELPYTLPQDSTLYLTLKHRDAEIWKRKLDWVAERGGMALVNTHPDYMRFDHQISPDGDYDARIYREFLRHVRQRYADRFWNCLPAEMARYARPFLAPRENAPLTDAR